MASELTFEQMSESDEYLRALIEQHSATLNDAGQRCAICFTRIPCDITSLAASGLHRSEQLAAVTAERDALRKTIAALIRTFVSTHGLSFVQANAQEPSNRRISLMMEWGTVRAAVSAWEQERAALAARGGEVAE